MAKLRFEHTTEPITCHVPWTSEDAGYTLSKEEIIAKWSKPHLRPCGLRHGVVEKRWCKFKCKYSIKNENAPTGANSGGEDKNCE